MSKPLPPDVAPAVFPWIEANQGLIAIFALVTALAASVAVYGLQQSAELRAVERRNRVHREAAIYALDRSKAALTDLRDAQRAFPEDAHFDIATKTRRVLNTLVDLLHALAHGAATDDADAAIRISEARAALQRADRPLELVSNGNYQQMSEESIREHLNAFVTQADALRVMIDQQGKPLVRR